MKQFKTKADRALNFIDTLFGNKLVIAIASLFIIIAAGFYYFGILNIVVPTGEDCCWVVNKYLSEAKTGIKSNSFGRELFSGITNLIAYRIYGLSFDTVRMASVFRYCIIVLITILIIFCVKKNDDKLLYLSPVIILFLVELTPLSRESNYGFADTPNQDILHYYPPFYHQIPLIAALICVLLLGLFLHSSNRIYKIIYAILLAYMSVTYTIRYGDIIFLALFVAPVILILFFDLVKNARWNKYIIAGVIFVLFVLAATKVMPGISDIRNKIWSSAYIEVYDTSVYGAPNWRKCSDLFGAVSETLRMILQMFGADRSDMTILSAWTLVLAVKVVLLILLAVIVLSVFVSVLNGTAEQKGYDFVDRICALGILILLAAKTFTVFNYVHAQDRYFFGIVVYSAIILVRNFKSTVNNLLNVNIFESSAKRLSLFVIGILICIMALNNVWGYEKIDSQSENMQKCIDYIKENGDGYVIGPFTVAQRMAIQAQGDVLFFEYPAAQHKLMGGDEPPRYVLANTDENAYFAFVYDIFKDITDEYGEPIEVVKFGDIWLHVMY